MNWAAMGFGLGFLVQAGALVYYAGRLTKSVETVIGRVDGHTTWIKEVAKQGIENDKRITVIEDWRERMEKAS